MMGGEQLVFVFWYYTVWKYTNKVKFVSHGNYAYIYVSH